MLKSKKDVSEVISVLQKSPLVFTSIGVIGATLAIFEISDQIPEYFSWMPDGLKIVFGIIIGAYSGAFTSKYIKESKDKEVNK